MSLRSKIVLILATVAVLYVAIDVALMRAMVAEPFRALEEEEAVVDVERVKAGLAGVSQDLTLRARSLATRGDTRRYLESGDPDFERDVLGPDTLAIGELNLLFLCDARGRVLWGRIEDSETREQIRVREFPASEIGTLHPVVLTRGTDDHSQGMMNTERGPMLVSSCEVSGANGPLGSVILGRFFDAELKQEILSRTNVSVDIWPLLEHQLPARAAQLVDRITSSPEPVADPVGSDELHLYATINDIREAPSLLMRASFQRTISRSGFRIFNFALLSTIATALLLLLVLLRLLNTIVIRPLTQLTRHTVEIGQTEDMSRRVAMEREDELGQLSKEFDGLMGKLAHSREQVIDTARQAGMSEIATGVLHNVGNVLNSVNVSANLVKRKTQQMSLGDLQAMTDVLGAHKDDLGRFVAEDPQGQQFLPFLTELTREMHSQRGEIVDELSALNKGVEHIMELVRSQQSYAGAAGVFEPTDLGEQLEAALSICEQAYGFTADLTVERDVDDLPKVPIDKHKLMEILVNLIQNAQQVMEDAGVDGKRMVLRVRRDGDEHAVIEVQDNGPGIEEENLARIFNHGFTTRKDGHGFGLHISANAATEMKASLWAESDGLGHGATFLLRVPMNTANLSTAA
ncbi:MAG: ATP-binding protein [Planctomycetota bacterium]